MVDFNNEATIGTPAAEIEKVSILQRRYDWIEAYEEYKKNKFKGQAQNLSIVRARLLSLFLEVQAMIKRKKPEQYDDLKKACSEDTEEKNIVDAFLFINELLDELKLTRIDTKKVYDTTNVELENEEKDY